MPLDARPTAPMPAPPERQYSFTDWQIANPTAPPPGDRLDAEYDRANTAIADVMAWASVALNTDGTIRASALPPDETSGGDTDTALEQDYALVCQAWAEHMPDTIPPNILAVMGVTGDHWSSRWWANQAAQTVTQLASIAATETPPPLTNGKLWFDPVSTQLYVGYDDGNSVQWVIANNMGGGGGGVVRSVIDLGTVAAAAANFAFVDGRIYAFTLGVSTLALTVSTSVARGTMITGLLIVTQDLTGSREINWPINFRWQGGFAPSLSNVAGSTDIIQISTYDGGLSWFAAIAMQAPPL